MTEQAADAPPPSTPLATARRPKRYWPYWIGALVTAIIVWNAVVFIPAYQALTQEEDASMIAYRSWLISPSQIIIDVRSVKGIQSMVGMDRMLLKVAEALKERSYASVVLAHRGTAKFVMDGTYFNELGATRQTQNPLYTIRTMQEHLHNPDGTPAFGVWSGGWLGVLGKQMEDHNEFHKRWWLDDELSRGL